MTANPLKNKKEEKDAKRKTSLRLLSKRMSISEEKEGETGEASVAAAEVAAAAAAGNDEGEHSDDGSEDFNTNTGMSSRDAAPAGVQGALDELDGETVHADASTAHHLAEAALAPGGEGEETATGEGAEDKRRGSMLVQHAKLDEDSTNMVLEEMKRIQLEKSPREAEKAVKMEAPEVSTKRIKRMSVVGTRGYVRAKRAQRKAEGGVHNILSGKARCPSAAEARLPSERKES